MRVACCLACEVDARMNSANLHPRQPSTMSPLPIEQLGPYRLGQKLGQGGMGTVYEAVDVQSAEPAAVKVLSPALAAEDGFRVRFEAEIESLKKLRHANIV